MDQEESDRLVRTSGSRRFIGAICALIVALGSPDHARASELDELMGPEAAGNRLSQDELTEQRGGFYNANGLLVRFGLDLTTTINGEVQRQTKIIIGSLSTPTVAAVDAGKAKSLSVPTSGSANANIAAAESEAGKVAEAAAAQTPTPPATPQVTLGMTPDGKLVVEDNTTPLAPGEIATSDPSPSKGVPAAVPADVGQDLATLKPGQMVDPHVLTSLIQQQTQIVNDQNNVKIQQMRSLTVDIANFSDLSAQANGLLGASLASFVNSQILFSMPR